MNPWLAAALGFVAFPVVYLGIALTPWHGLAAYPRGERGNRGCAICGYEVTARRPLTLWLNFQRHQMAIRPRRWHKQALAVWRLELGRDPLTGAMLPRSTGEEHR